MPDPLELVPLGTMTIELRAPVVIKGGPAGDRIVVEVASGRLEGDRLSAKTIGAANADWATVGPDGTATLDVRALMETDDGATIFCWYHGRTDFVTMYSTPRFETSDDRYRWLNGVQAVGKGSMDGTTLTYDLYELR
jgi:hypothetical protein